MCWFLQGKLCQPDSTVLCVRPFSIAFPLHTLSHNRVKLYHFLLCCSSIYFHAVVSGRPADHADKSESFQSFLDWSIIPTRKTLITPVSRLQLSQISWHLHSLRGIILWMCLLNLMYTWVHSGTLITAHIHTNTHWEAHRGTDIHKNEHPLQSYPHSVSVSHLTKGGWCVHYLPLGRSVTGRGGTSSSISKIMGLFSNC